MKTTTNKISRRKFISNAVATSAGLTIIPSHVVSGLGHKAPSDRLNIAGIGIGGRGYINLRNVETENIVSLCDVDWDYAANTFKRWPMAKQYKDYRRMLDEQKDIDAVVIATPDHSHALPAALAMRMGKHVFLQAPLTHSIYEARLLVDNAVRYRVSTQMGNQGNSDEGIRRICEWIWAGTIGEITHVDAWTTRPIWPQNLQMSDRNRRPPRNLDWDLFIGTSAWRDYNSAFHPWTWRAWWNFGNGATGEMGTHILDPVFKALTPGYPASVEASSSEFNYESPPNSTCIRYEFPRRDNLPKVAMPAFTVNWYEGGWLPPRPAELANNERMGDETGGCIFHGTQGKIMCGAYAQNPTLLPVEKMESFTEPARTIRRIFNPLEGGHEQDWVRSCKEPADTRLEPSSNFSYSGPLSETVLLGALAIKLQGLHRKLEWDGVNMRFLNIDSGDTVRIPVNSNFEVSYGNGKLIKEYISLQASTASEEWIRHNYRNGWEQI